MIPHRGRKVCNPTAFKRGRSQTSPCPALPVDKHFPCFRKACCVTSLLLPPSLPGLMPAGPRLLPTKSFLLPFPCALGVPQHPEVTVTPPLPPRADAHGPTSPAHRDLCQLHDRYACFLYRATDLVAPEVWEACAGLDVETLRPSEPPPADGAWLAEFTRDNVPPAGLEAALACSLRSKRSLRALDGEQLALARLLRSVGEEALSG